MWTGSALQLHPHPMVVVDEDATGELLVRTVKYFKSIESVARGMGFEQILPSKARTGRKTAVREKVEGMSGSAGQKDDRSVHVEEAEILAKEIEALKMRNMKPLTSTYLAAPATEYPVRSQSPDKDMKRQPTPELRNESMGSRIDDAEGEDVKKREMMESGIARAVTPELRNESMHSRVQEETAQSGIARAVTPELRNDSMHSRVPDGFSGGASLEVPKSEGVSRSTTPDLVNDSMHSRVDSGVEAGEVKDVRQSLLATPSAMEMIRSVTPELVNDSMHSRVVGAV